MKERTGSDEIVIERPGRLGGVEAGCSSEAVCPTRNHAEPILTLKEAASYVRISKAHLSNLINGKVPGVSPPRIFRAGRRILIRREWLDHWVEQSHLEAIR